MIYMMIIWVYNQQNQSIYHWKILVGWFQNVSNIFNPSTHFNRNGLIGPHPLVVYSTQNHAVYHLSLER